MLFLRDCAEALRYHLKREGSRSVSHFLEMREKISMKERKMGWGSTDLLGSGCQSSDALSGATHSEGGRPMSGSKMRKMN